MAILTMHRAPGPSGVHRGVALIDLMVAMAIIGVVLLAVIPSTRSEEPLKLVSATTMIAADVEYAQSLTLASPSQPTVVVFDAPGGRYWLAEGLAPDTPIESPSTGEPWMRAIGEGALLQLAGTALDTHNVGWIHDDGTLRLEFDAFGRLNQSGDLAIEVSNTSGSMFVHVRETTGTVAVTGVVPEAVVDAVDASDGPVRWTPPTPPPAPPEREPEPEPESETPKAPEAGGKPTEPEGSGSKPADTGLLGRLLGGGR
jgi:hypothetical protein